MKMFLDMDGVIADFTAGICAAFNIPFSNEPYPFPVGLWDWVAWLQETHGVSWTDVGTVCSRPDFWADLPLLPDAARFYCAMSDKHDVHFLTTPTGRMIECFEGKRAWLEMYRFASRHDKRMTLLEPGESKADYANPFTVLIDDQDKNVQEFIKAGGQAILVPRPWNNRHFEFQSFEQANRLVEANLETII